MQLKHVEIKNYRSIEKLELHFDPKCRILVGINESGKTNILDALNLLDPEESTTRRDVRESRRNEGPIVDAHVRFVFGFTPGEVDEITINVKKKVLSKTYLSHIITASAIRYTLEELCASREGLYIADVSTAAKRFSTWSLKEPQRSSNWKKVTAVCPADFEVYSGDSEKAYLKSFTLVDSPEFVGIPNTYLEDASWEDLWLIVSTAVEEEVKRNLLKVSFWNYDEANLLSSRINLEQFCATPEKCLPLRRMFQLYGISDIKKDVDSAKASSANFLANLLRRVAEKTSTHFHETWHEYDGIRFSLATDGPDLVAGIEDESNHYELSQRSDGFKRFVTFLLMVSAPAESRLLKDTFLLIDEPEIGLHPTGARYLMDELIDISRDNYVVFTTHSIFMVDNKKIDRHLIVKKEKEITTVSNASESNIQDEEVIYKSLGYSIFLNLKEKNLTFKGWRDKRLFEVALSRVPSEYEDVKQLKTLPNLGHCFAHGVKQIMNITPLFEAGNRKCLILTDSDSPAKEFQKKYRSSKGFGVWKRYDELAEATAAVTGEDFIKETAFKTLVDAIKDKHNIPALTATELNGSGGKIAVLRKWLSTNGIEQDQVSKYIETTKDKVFEDLRPAEIKTEYYDYLRRVLASVQNL